MSTTSLTKAVQTLLNKAVTNNVAPGLIASVFTPTSTILSLSSGYSNVTSKDPMTPSTTVFYASMGKAISSVVALTLVEKTGFDLDSHEALVKVLPELKLRNGKGISTVFDGRDVEGKLKTREAEEGITLRHLLDHTSGLGYKFFDPTLAEYYGAKPLKGIGKVEDFSLVRLFESGTNWCYGCSTEWVGFFIERVSQKPLRQAYQDLLFTPLGIPKNGLDTFVGPEMREDRSSLHSKFVDGTDYVCGFA